jgi:signal transduction histidine kinase/CheY-like chemotaxis protein
MTILVVDDNETNLYQLQVLLGASGYQVVTAANGAEALEKARQSAPDLIITDILMPVMDGFSLCRAWKGDERLAHIPVVFYTATYTDSRDEEFALGLGAARFIVKPQDPGDFLESIRDVIETHKRGGLVAQPPLMQDEAVLLKEYNEALIRKLEDKMGQLEDAKRELERDIIARKRAEQNTAALLEIAKELSGTLNPDDLIKCVQQRTATLLPCDRIVTYYWDAARTAYRAIAWYGVPPEFVPDTLALEFHSGQEVVDHLLVGETVLINDPSAQTMVPADTLAHFQLTAVLVVPLMVHGRTLGALAALNAESGRRFDAHQVQLFEGVAQQVGIALEAADLYRGQQEEAEMSGALVRVGRELTASLDTPILLDRLCQLTTEVLACDFSNTILRGPEGSAYVPVAQHGNTPEQWESMRVLKIPLDAVAPLLARLERHDVVQERIAEGRDFRAGALPGQYGMTAGLYMALRRGGKIVGIQTAGYRGRQGAFTPQQRRIAGGLAQTASLVLENARLVEDLKRANRLKSEFVATMSHELRTPLNIIMGYNDLLLEEAFGGLTPEQAESLQSMQRSSSELLELITATLDLSRLETGRLPLDVAVIDLPDLLDEIEAETRAAREEKPQVALRWQIPPGLPPLQTDGVKLKIVLKNLISNALKFTDHGSVTVSVAPADGGVAITVADTGIGVAAEAREIIFEPFRQVDGSLTRPYGGVGLGLYVVRRLLDMLGGTISVDSKVGRGSTFRVRLPSNVPPPAP